MSQHHWGAADHPAEQFVHWLQLLDLGCRARGKLGIEGNERFGADPVVFGKQDVESDDLGLARCQFLGQPG